MAARGRKEEAGQRHTWGGGVGVEGDGVWGARDGREAARGGERDPVPCACRIDGPITERNQSTPPRL